MSIGTINGYLLPTLVFILSFGLNFGLLYWMLLGLFQGIEQIQIEDHAHQVPNQGIQQSLRNGLILGLISGGSIGIIGTLGYTLSMGVSRGIPEGVSWVQSHGLIYGLTITVCGGLVVWASRGGLAVLRHYTIRQLLARSHLFPWNAPRFLEEATAHILLRRVGGVYISSSRIASCSTISRVSITHYHLHRQTDRCQMHGPALVATMHLHA